MRLMSRTERMPGTLSPMKTSAFSMASPSRPLTCRGFVAVATQRFMKSMPTVRPRWSVPCSSTPTMSRTPLESRILMVAVPAAPTPVTTTRSFFGFLRTMRSAFSSAARTTTAVPCWSSWNTGISRSLRSRSSISKQRGAAISSRLTPPKAGASSFTVSTILSLSLVARQTGKASTPANSLKSIALPSITGSAASGPMSPNPSTAVPSVTTATELCFMVRAKARSRSSRMARHTRATPGVYTMERSSRVRTGTLFLISIFPPRCIRNVRSETLTTRTPAT